MTALAYKTMIRHPTSDLDPYVRHNRLHRPHIPSLDRLHAASEALHHRGPDGEGAYTHYFQDQSVALVHRHGRKVC